MNPTFREAIDSNGKRHPFWDAERRTGRSGNELAQWLEGRNLSKGEVCTLDPHMKQVQIALSWDKGADIDASVALFDEQLTSKDSVSYKRLKSRCGSVLHSGDNLDGDGAGDDEVITVDLATLPIDIRYVLFVVTIFSEDVSFRQVERLCVKMRDAAKTDKGDEFFVLHLSDLSGHAMLVGQLIRRGAYWDFKALGTPAAGRNNDEVLRCPRIREPMSSCPSSAPTLHHISVRVLEGRNLAPKDRCRWTKNEGSSDPYYKVKFRKAKMKSSYVPKLLNPVWKSQSFDMGSIMESETDMLDVVVFDYDCCTHDDFMGVVQIEAGQLHNLGLGKHTFWFELEKSPDKKYKHEEVSGEVLLEINITE